MAKVTIVITAYNLEKYISKTLEELFNQSFQDFEIFLIDDCSKDTTISIAKSYVDKFNGKLNIVKLKKNQGLPSKTRNYFLKNIKYNSEYIVFLDGDDSIENTYLEELVTCAEQNKSDIVVCGYDRINEKDNKVLCDEMLGFPKQLKYDKDDTLCFINGSVWNKLFRSEILKNIYFPEIKIGEDLCFQHYIYQKRPKINFINKKLIHYQVHDNSVMTKTKNEDILDLANQFVILKNNASDEYEINVCTLLAFIHIGIAMAIKAYNNPNINNRQHIKWTMVYFKDNYDLKNSKFLKFKNLKTHGIKGYALFICKILYKINLFIVFLKLYNFMTKVLKKDFKF